MTATVLQFPAQPVRRSPYLAIEGNHQFGFILILYWPPSGGGYDVLWEGAEYGDAVKAAAPWRRDGIELRGVTA